LTEICGASGAVPAYLDEFPWFDRLLGWIDRFCEVPMQSIGGYMSGDHRYCDELFAEAEGLVEEGAQGAADAQRAFSAALLSHFAMEEETLFPAFEAATGMSGGPTMMMRHEHQQMRQLIERIESALAEDDRQAALGVTETLMVMMQQHNLKEEQILYPMAEQYLANESSLLLEQLAGYRR
jgi:hemerythrin superfamily protein